MGAFSANTFDEDHTKARTEQVLPQRTNEIELDENDDNNNLSGASKLFATKFWNDSLNILDEINGFKVNALKLLRLG